MPNLARELADWQFLKERLLAQHPDLAEDEQALIDTLDGETTLTDALIAVLRSADDDLIHVAGIKDREDELSARKQRLEARAKSKRQLVHEAMEKAGISKLPAPDFTASIGAGRQAVVVTDIAALPPAYVRVEMEPKKADIAAALKNGQDVPGAMLGNGGTTLRISRK